LGPSSARTAADPRPELLQVLAEIEATVARLRV
jgi:hypothetical protein